MTGETKDYPILNTINSPADLKKLSLEELTKLAAEVRERIIKTVAKTGGHLAPSLGVVELTIALHRLLESPRDRIVWDTGHQAYPHKILTGRRGGMKSLRQKGGIAGFPRREESPYDAFGTAHSSTSISAALGMAVAAQRRGLDHRCRRARPLRCGPGRRLRFHQQHGGFRPAPALRRHQALRLRPRAEHLRHPRVRQHQARLRCLRSVRRTRRASPRSGLLRGPALPRRSP